MKKPIVIIFTILLLLAGLYAFIYEWALPHAAQWGIPRKWKNLPLRQQRNIVIDYLGQPVPAGNNPAADTWSSGATGKQYRLRVYYHTDSSIAGYAVRYHYSNALFSRRYLLDSVSVK